MTTRVGAAYLGDNPKIAARRQSPSPWVNLSLATGWTAYGGGFLTPGYRKIGDLVYLRGLLNAGVGVTTLMATLPAGFRPTATVLTSCFWMNAGAHSRIDIGGGTGAIYIYQAVNGAWFCLDSVPPFSIT
jgi:hypothetical protein